MGQTCITRTEKKPTLGKVGFFRLADKKDKIFLLHKLV